MNKLIDLQYALFLFLAPGSAIVCVGMLLYARRYRDSAPAETAALNRLVIPVVGWLTLNTLELASLSATGTLFWAKATYLFIAATPVAWLAFALQYAGQNRWLKPARFAWFGVIPALTLLLVLTNSRHGLIWQAYKFVPVRGLPPLGDVLAMRVTDYGSFFWLHAVYAHALVFLGSFLIVRQHFRSFTLYRRQSILVVIGGLIPSLANAVYIFHLVPGLVKDYTSMSFALASMAFVFGIFFYGLFDLKPIARDVVVDNMRDAMLAIDIQERIVDVNPAAQSLLATVNGQGGGETLIGKPLAQALEPWEATFERFRGALEIQADIAVQVGGAPRHYDVRVSPLTSRRGRLAGRLIVLHDITAQKAAEERLRQYAHELEAQNKELDAFARTVAHDLKNPLSVIISYSEWVEANLDEMGDQDIQELLTLVRRSGQTMVGIVDGLLLLSSVRRCDEVALDLIDMGTLVQKMLQHMAHPITESGAQIKKPSRWPMVRSYGPWVTAVWTNYVSNALKYGGRPQAQIPPHIELGFDEIAPRQQDGSRRDLPATYIRFWVRDNGPGLSQEEQALLFTEFTRLGKKEVEGYGLGLAITRRIVEKMGGQVGVESEIGQGSTFWFTLPRGRQQEKQ